MTTHCLLEQYSASAHCDYKYSNCKTCLYLENTVQTHDATLKRDVNFAKIITVSLLSLCVVSNLLMGAAIH